MTSGQLAVRCEGLTHVYRDDEGEENNALIDVDLEVDPGEAVAVVGPSGAGKSTLLTLLAGLVRPTAGRIVIGGQEITTMSEHALLRVRAGTVAMVLQHPARNLLPYATAEQNILFAQRSGVEHSRAERRATAADLLRSVGLTQHAHRRAVLMSGGEQQRLALAVALAAHPRVLLADEPTSQLDRPNAAAIVSLMLAARERTGIAMVTVTHDPFVSSRLDTQYTLHDGALTAHPRSGDGTDPGAGP